VAQTPAASNAQAQVTAQATAQTRAQATSGASSLSDKDVDAFRTFCRSKAKAAEKAYSISVEGRNGWLFSAPELRHIAAGKFWGEAAARVSQSPLAANADPLPAIVDFKRQLDRAGIELLLVPVPPKGIVYPDMLWDKATARSVVPRFDVAHQLFYGELKKNDIPVLDLTDELTSRRFDAQGTTYCKQDTHWSGRATVLAARSIAATLADREWLRSRPKRTYAQQWQRMRIAGDLWPGVESDIAQETLPLRFVGTPAKAKTAASTRPANATLQPLTTDRNSPVLLLGDSHTLVFHEGGDMHARGAGLPDQLALELGFPVDLIGVRGSGATPARTTLMRRARANPNYLKGKKLVIWCFSAREFTESSGWQKVPVVS
jgi:alginate O-acetyltransferase complex protein AlgJ